MLNYTLNVKDSIKEIYPSNLKMGGINPQGQKISFTNYYMEENDHPFFGISGEFHFSRYNYKRWEDEIIKMKMGGINIISTYIFWIHHEEEQGIFDWDGNKNLRGFVELCGKHKLKVNIRIGPFNHGEVRNGGIPDWLFGRPFEIRSNDEEYLFFAERLYKQIGRQVKGLLFKDGGPIISTQLENEYQASAAPWESTTGTSNEWLTGGRDGSKHITKLKELALKAEIDTPIYSVTGWGGAPVPNEEYLPLWGGYAYWPWIFYNDVDTHPATPCFLFRHYHNNDYPKTYDFEPSYQPESVPFACAEMGGGMTVFYNYRFKLPYESVDALSAIKVGGGCNFVGYYMFHGGSNPKGKKTPYLNENSTPKISYDYQAAIGEFGQLRESYHRLKRQHLFYQKYQEQFLKTKTILSKDQASIVPEDVDTLRYAARVNRDSGFLFINNFQDHVENKKLKDFSITLDFGINSLRIPETGTLSIEKDENCILPLNFNLDEDVNLLYSTTQLITDIEYEGAKYYFFYIPNGMSGEYVLESNNLQGVEIDYGVVHDNTNQVLVKVDNLQSHIVLTKKDGKKIYICTITNKQSMDLWQVRLKGQDRILLTDANVLISGEQLRLEYEGNQDVDFSIFPSFEHQSITVAGQKIFGKSKGLFTKFLIQTNEKEVKTSVKQISDSKAIIHLNSDSLQEVKELLLNIEYSGDIGYAFIDGELISDNYNNNDRWEIGLKQYEKELHEKELYLYASPIKNDKTVKSDTSMAARLETIETTARIKSIEASSIYEVEVIY
ncbi:beta-galactosidase [Bacillus sp. TS-2]|nr:beta-galactosidase [Bacillus sp. TS-2]